MPVSIFSFYNSHRGTSPEVLHLLESTFEIYHCPQNNLHYYGPQLIVTITTIVEPNMKYTLTSAYQGKINIGNRH